MNKVNEEKNLWDDYLVVGLTIAMLLTIIDGTRVVYQVVPTIVFYIFTGIKENTRFVCLFLKRAWMVGLIAIGCAAYVIFVRKSPELIEYIVIFFFIILAGYCLVFRCNGSCQKALKKVLIYMVAVLLLDLSKIIRGSSARFLLNISHQSNVDLIEKISNLWVVLFLVWNGVGIVIGILLFSKYEKNKSQVLVR